MILSQLHGGLGNQMFQYAAGRALAERHSVPLLLDVRVLHDWRRTDTPRPYALNPFALEFRIAEPGEIRAFTWRRRLGRARTLREKGHAFNMAFSHAGPDTRLIGYWQSERYFTDVASILRREFTIRASPSARDAALLSEIGQQHAVSVHIRRGDYVTNAATHAFHGLMPLDYYLQGVAHVLQIEPNAHFYVFSDDPVWARENLRLPGPATFIDHHAADQGHEDLRLMRACQHHIIANSSFSWWGAWLSERSGKVVIAPRRWFQASNIDTSDICPPEWIRL